MKVYSYPIIPTLK